MAITFDPDVASPERLADPPPRVSDKAPTTQPPAAAEPPAWSLKPAQRRELPPLSEADRERFAQARTAAETLGRQVGLTARAGIEGTIGTLNRVFDATIAAGINAAVDGLNSVAGTSVPHVPSTARDLQRTMNRAGLPQPENATERVVQTVAGAMATGGVIYGAALGVNAAATSAVVASVAGQIAAAPLTTTFSTAAGAASSGVVREAGGSTGAQIAAAVIGAAVPAGIAVAATRQAATTAVSPTVAVVEAATVRFGNLKLPLGAQAKLVATGSPNMSSQGSVAHFPVEVRADALVFAGFRDRGLTVQVYSAKGEALGRFVTNSEAPITVPLTALPRGSTMTVDLTCATGRAHNPVYHARPAQDFSQYSFTTNGNKLTVTQTESGLVVKGQEL